MNTNIITSHWNYYSCAKIMKNCWFYFCTIREIWPCTVQHQLSPFIWGPKETACLYVVPLSTTCRVWPPLWVVHPDLFNCWWFPHLTIPHRCLLLITRVGHDWHFASNDSLLPTHTCCSMLLGHSPPLPFI